MDLDIGAKRPVDADLVYAVGRFLTNEPSYVLLYDPSKFTPRTRYAKRNLVNVTPEAVVEQLGGSNTFGRLELPRWGTAWIRRATVLDVQPGPPEYVRLGGFDVGAIILMRFEPPVRSYPFLPPGTPFGFGAHGLTAEQVKAALGL